MEAKGGKYTFYNEEEVLPIEIRRILEVEDRGESFEINSSNTKLLEILKKILVNGSPIL